MPPAGWGYALAWFFLNDGVKLVAYRIFDADHSGMLTKAGARQKPT
jgi:H+-transporting ATPase